MQLDRRLNVSHDRLPTKCGNTFWIVPDKPKVVVAPNHPGAIEISCGKCLRCLITKRNMHVGRMIAEQHGSVASVMLTLTFASDEALMPAPGSQIGPQVPRDNKRYWKAAWKEYWARAREPWTAFRGSLRKRYGQTQYCGAAELGELRGRLHFHVAVFFGEGNKIPEWVYLPRRVESDYRNAVRAGALDADGSFISCGVKCQKQYSIKGRKDQFIAWLPEWPHGYVHIGEMNEKSAGYIAKYCMKPADAAVLRGANSPHNSFATKIFRSHKLAYRFARELGEQAAEQGLEPMARYRLDGQVYASGPRAGHAREYLMTRGMKRECGMAHMRRVASMLATGELKRWVAKPPENEGFLVAESLVTDLERDPREVLEKFFRKLSKEKRGQWSLPHIDLGPIRRAVLAPDGGMVAVSSFGETVFMWPDLSGHGGDFVIPIKSRRELLRAVRLGGVEAFGLHPPDARIVVDPGERGVRRRSQVLADGGARVWPVRQTMERGGRGVADDAMRDAVAETGGSLLLKVRRAWASDRQIEAIRARIVRLYAARWCPSAADLGSRRRPVGLPSRWSGRVVTAEDAERFPLWCKWMREADPHGPPF